MPAVTMRAMLWVLDNSQAELGSRLVMLAIAEYAHDDGTGACPSVATIMAKTRLSRRSVQTLLRSLEKAGEIDPTGMSEEYGTMTYRIPRMGGADYDAGGAQILRRGGAKSAPEPELQPTPKEKTPPIGPPRSVTVDRKPVTDAEWDLASRILEEFNRLAGTRYSAGAWVAKVIMRIREHSELELEDHSRTIDAAFRDPWWRGPASPSVIYGNGAIFEQSLGRVPSGGTAAAKFPDLDDV